MQRTSRSPRRWMPRRRHLRSAAWLLVNVWLLAVMLDRATAIGSEPLGPAPAVGQSSRTPLLTKAPRRRRRRNAPELAAASASYSRFSSHMQDEVTIESQQRDCREWATRDGQGISPELEFFDEAVSGTKRDRLGLNGLLEAAAEGKFNTLYFFSLSRLARESVIGMPILKRLVNRYKIRVISQSEGLDTCRDGWEMSAQILLMQHERYIKELSANSFRGQAMNVERGYSNGDYCLGYMGRPIPGSEQTRRGRRPQPRMETVIDPEKSQWVIRIFRWFVVERRPIRWIVHTLNDLNAPKDHRATTPTWRHSYVLGLLSNTKYVGDWPWGELKNNRDPETGDLYQEPRSEEQTARYRRSFPELRLIDDATFARAQELLKENRERFAKGRDEDGEFVKGRAGAPRPANHLLARLCECGSCGARLYVGGAHGKYLICPNRLTGTCSCKTQLRRDLAERLILAEVGRRIGHDTPWFEEVLTQLHAAWARRQATLPDEIRNLESALEELDRKIARLLDRLESQPVADPDIDRRLAERRVERRTLREQLDAAQAAARVQPTEPTAEWLRTKLAALHDVLRDATPAAGHTLAALVGGVIRLRETPLAGKKRCYFVGTLRLPTTAAAAFVGNESPPEGTANQAGDNTEEIAIEFREVDARDFESDAAWELREGGMPYYEIAARLNISKLKLTRLMRRAAERRGVPFVDGRGLRRAPPRKKDSPKPDEAA